MSCYTDNLRNRILDCLNIQQPERCRELAVLFERCNLRELHDIFPHLINSIFGLCDDQQTGWGLRTTTTRNALSYSFETLFNFFSPTGPMLKLCYRLINETFKYEVDLKLIPHRMFEMLQSGQHSGFYADLINIDQFTRTITGMSLNAFDYFILHFVAHGMVPLHTKYSLALEVHSEFTNTAYFMLVAHYLATFLPANVDAIIPPIDLILMVKAQQTLPMPALQPQTRSPKYLKIPMASLYAENRTSPTSSNMLTPNANEVSRLAGFTGDLVRNNTWRTETILHFFVDIWLRYDVDSAHHLPSSEFIRVVRLLVKYLHAFALSAPIDSTTMLHLRQLAQPMLRARIFPFLRCVIARWPLDSSMSMVLELWYSYIQPWRYVGYSESTQREFNTEFPADGRFDIFIAENLFIYTQIFVQVLPRFQRLDFTMLQNCIMLQRLVKVFCHSIPTSVLQETEERHLSCSFALDNSHKLSSSLGNRRSFQQACCDWEAYFSSEPYIPMFDISTKLEIEKFMRIVYSAQIHIKRELQRMSLTQNGNTKSNIFYRYFMYIFKNEETETCLKLKVSEQIPNILETCIQSLCSVFDLEIPEDSSSSMYMNDEEFSGDEETNKNSNLDITRISPTKMRSCLQNMLASPSVDPAVLPIQEHECKLLVRFLHQVSCKFNEMFGNEIQGFWQRTDLCGKLAHQIFLPPMTTTHFEKTRGYSELCEEKLPPRICLRFLGSYRSLALIVLALLCGKIFCGAPSFGLLMVLLIAFIYKIIMALFL